MKLAFTLSSTFLAFSLFSGCQKEELASTSTSIIFNPNLTYGSVSDIDGNRYKTIPIGTQTWIAENLKTTRYNDGTALPLVTDNGTWDDFTTPAYCWYNNDKATYKSEYGALYNKYASNSDKLCPVGWHVPSFEEWNKLCLYVQSFDIDTLVSMGMLKETGFTHWASSSNKATNVSGFTAIPGGMRTLWADGTAFRNMDLEASWWNSSPPAKIDNSYSWVNLGYNNSSIGIFGSIAIAKNKTETVGMSIRCLKN
jgi:uncharacterized protein (TIGR02145 family)